MTPQSEESTNQSSQKPTKKIHLVFLETGHFMGGFYNLEEAARRAEAMEGTVASLPIVEDFRV